MSANLLGYAIVYVGLLSSQAGAQAQLEGLVSTSGRELYVACSLHLVEASINGQVYDSGAQILPYSAPACLSTQVITLANFPQARPLPDGNEYCIPEDEVVRRDLPTAIAQLYIRHFENDAVRVADASGVAALVDALKTEWPCR